MKHTAKIFYAIATLAIENGYDLSLELKDNKTESKTFGSVATNNYTDGGLILRAYKPEQENCIDEMENDDE